MTSALPTQFLLEQHRQQFPALLNKGYFNYGGQGPMPQSALEAMHQAQMYVQQIGPFSGEVNNWLAQESAQTRQAIATELGTSADTITLTDSVSTGCNIALWGVNWQSGDHLLISDCEHPGILAAAQAIQRRFGIEISTCPLLETLNDGDPIQAIAQHLRPQTRMVVLSHILWNTGQVLPLKEIAEACHSYPGQYPIRVLVDAAQSVGVLPLNLTELQADYYAFTGHKWWCGPAGVGALYVRPEALEDLEPTFVGWRGITTDASGQPTGWVPGGKRFEIATTAVPLYAGLRVAIATHHTWGIPESRYQRIQQLSSNLWQRLSELAGITCLRTTPPESGLVSFQLTQSSHPQLAQFLETQKLMVRTIASPDCVRACLHYFTLENEVDRLVEAVQQFCDQAK